MSKPETLKFPLCPAPVLATYLPAPMSCPTVQVPAERSVVVCDVDSGAVTGVKVTALSPEMEI
jgi:hypothetical protein